MIDALSVIDHEATRRAVTIERAFLAELGTGCSLPVGAYVSGQRLYLFLADESDRVAVSDTVELDGELDADVAIAQAACRSAAEHVGRV